MSDATRLHYKVATGDTHAGGPSGGGRNPGYKRGGSVKKGHHTAHSGNMDGGIDGHHHHNHKSHGHHDGVVHTKTSGVGSMEGKGVKGGDTGPSKNQFGPGMPKGGTIGRW